MGHFVTLQLAFTLILSVLLACYTGPWSVSPKNFPEFKQVSIKQNSFKFRKIFVIRNDVDPDLGRQFNISTPLYCAKLPRNGSWDQC